MDIKELKEKKRQVEKSINTLKNESEYAIRVLLNDFQNECGVRATLRLERVEVTGMLDQAPRYTYSSCIDIQI